MESTACRSVLISPFAHGDWVCVTTGFRRMLNEQANLQPMSETRDLYEELKN